MHACTRHTHTHTVAASKLERESCNNPKIVHIKRDNVSQWATIELNKLKIFLFHSSQRVSESCRVAKKSQKKNNKESLVVADMRWWSVWGGRIDTYWSQRGSFKLQTPTSLHASQHNFSQLTELFFGLFLKSKRLVHAACRTYAHQNGFTTCSKYKYRQRTAGECLNKAVNQKIENFASGWMCGRHKTDSAAELMAFLEFFTI